jgi:nicotinamide mononucleotide transporter
VQDFVTTLASQARAFTTLETLAVALSIAYIVLAVRQNIWCWLCAGVSTAIFALLFFEVRLYMEAGLNVFYFAMAIYGWHSWYFGRSGEQDLPVIKWPARAHLKALVIIIAASVISGFVLDTRSNAAFPYIDSLTSWGAVWATYLVARKVLENWWYWLVIDATMIYVFWAKDLELTAVLYVLYLIFIPIGLIAWTRSYRQAQA